MAGGSKSKTKGNAGELQLCKLLGNIFEGSFIRSPNSGAYIGGKNVFRKATLSVQQAANRKGDVVPPDFLPKLVLECKSYSEFRFHQLIQPGACAQLDEWVQQMLDVIDPGDEWFVVFKINRMGWFVVVPEIASDGYVFGSHARYEGPLGAFRVTELESFFRANKALVAARAA